MRLRSYICLIACILTPLLPAQAIAPSQPPRWVLADDVRVRSGPSMEHRIDGTLPRGAELLLKDPNAIDGYCLVEGEGHYGYVACKYLSAQRVARPRAGIDGVDANQRWVGGNALTLREAPRIDAAVVGRLSLNAVVTLVREVAGSGYCEVKPGDAPAGYTACRYLMQTPLVLAHVRDYHGAGQTPPGYDPERAFWLEPSWRALEQYAEYLKTRHPDIPPHGPWPRDEALERMKAHLALGLKGQKPPAYADWAALKRKAGQDLDLGNEAQRLQSQGKEVPDSVRQRQGRLYQVAGELQQVIGNFSHLPDTGTDSGAARTIQFIRALEFPSVRPSLFRSEAEVAPPDASTEAVSGRFGIVFRQVVSRRPQTKPDSEDWSGAGLYDMRARTQVLVRPVKQVQLFRDGRTKVESTLVRKKEELWREYDEPECAGWTPGFAFGDADEPLWQSFVDAGEPVVRANPAGSLYAFYTTIDMPGTVAKRSEMPVKMNRAQTGFVRGSFLYYDFDADGVLDLVVWEGLGRGPGHLEGPTTTDDRWYRLVVINIDGAWKVLGTDSFGYGCGC